MILRSFIGFVTKQLVNTWQSLITNITDTQRQLVVFLDQLIRHNRIKIDRLSTVRELITKFQLNLH